MAGDDVAVLKVPGFESVLPDSSSVVTGEDAMAEVPGLESVSLDSSSEVTGEDAGVELSSSLDDPCIGVSFPFLVVFESDSLAASVSVSPSPRVTSFEMLSESESMGASASLTSFST